MDGSRMAKKKIFAAQDGCTAVPVESVRAVIHTHQQSNKFWTDASFRVRQSDKGETQQKQKRFTNLRGIQRAPY